MFDTPRQQLGRVLVVDDEPDIRKMVRTHLERANFEVVEAENGSDAIALLNSGDNPVYVDMILCDIRMPKLNGIDAIDYFRREYPALPLVVLTGFPDLHMATTLLRRGVTDYLVKPVEKDKLLQTVHKAVEAREMFKNQFAT